MSLTIKTEFKRSNGEVDIRRTRLTEGSNRYEQLINYLDSTYGQLYGIGRSAYALSYVDPDGDQCSINSDAELLECCRCAEEDKKTAKIQVKVAEDMSASSISRSSVSRSVSQASSRAEAPSPINATVSVSQPGSNPQPSAPEVDSDSEYVQVDTSRPATPRPATPFIEPVSVEVKPVVPEIPAPVADKPVVPSVTVEDVTEDDREENALVEAIMASFSSAPNVQVTATSTGSQKPHVVPSVFTTVTSNVTEEKDESKVDSSNATSNSVVNDHVHYGVVCDGCQASPLIGDRFKCTICHDFDLCSECEHSGKSFGRHANTHSMIKISAAASQPRVAPVRPAQPTVTPAQPSSDIHAGVSCDVCGVAPITGIRYKCTACHNYDMCASCEAKDQHDPKHVLLKFRQHLTGADVQNAILNRVSHWWRRGGNHHGPHGHGPNAGFTGPHPGHHHRWGRCGRGRAEFGATAGAEDTRPRAAFVSESLSDGSSVAPGSTFQKVWQIQNNGDKAWPEGCSLNFVGGDLTAADQSGRPVEHTTNSVPVSAQPGEVVTIKLDVQAPQEEGRFRSTFRLMTKEQERFGPRMWIDVEVKAPSDAAAPSARSEPASSPTQTMPVAEPVQDPIRGAIHTLVSALGAQGGSSPVASFLDLIQGHGRNTPRAERPTAAAPVAQPEHFAYQAELATIREMGIEASDDTLKRLLTRYNGSVPRTVSQLFEESN